MFSVRVTEVCMKLKIYEIPLKGTYGLSFSPTRPDDRAPVNNFKRQNETKKIFSFTSNMFSR